MALLQLRREAEALIDRLIEVVDAIDPDTDREPEPDGCELETSEGDGESDDEPSLGAPEQSLHHVPRDQRVWATGADDDREHDDADDPRGEFDLADDPAGEGGPSGGLWGVVPA